MAFTVPNLLDAEDATQAQLDSRDLGDILAAAFASTGVVTGCAVSAQGTPDMTLAVASGTVLVGGVSATVSAGNVTVTAADGTNPRFDLVCVDSAGTKSVVAGTPAASPVFPNPAGKVVLAAVRVPAAATSINGAKIVDKRVITVVAAGSGLPADTVVDASTRIIANKLLAGDTQPSWRLMGDGKQEWGVGGTTAPSTSLSLASGGGLAVSRDLFIRKDTGVLYFGTTDDVALYRQGAGLLRTDASLTVGNTLLATSDIAARSGAATKVLIGSAAGYAGILFGSSGDTSLYRYNTKQLQTDGEIRSQYATAAATSLCFTTFVGGGTPDTYPRLQITSEGSIMFGIGNALPPAKLMYWWQSGLAGYRMQITGSDLAVSGAYYGGNAIFTNVNSMGGNNAQVAIGYDGSAGGKNAITMYGGSAYDVLIQRSAAGVLDFGRTNLKGAIRLFGSAAADLLIQHLVTTDAAPRFTVAADGTQNWGPGTAGTDVQFYRNAGPYLRTNGQLQVDGQIYANFNDANTMVRVGSVGANAGIVFGTALDTTLYRSAAGVLRTGGAFLIDSSLWIDQSNVGARFYFGSAGDTQLYRNAAGQLRTDSMFLVIRAAVNDSAIYSGISGDAGPRFQTLAGGTLTWGPGNAGVDTTLYRAGVGSLVTNGNLTANVGTATQAAFFNYAGQAAVGFHSSIDTFLYRKASTELTTNGNFTVKEGTGGHVQIGQGGGFTTISGIWFGTALDTAIYRSAANQIKTDGMMQAVNGFASITNNGTVPDNALTPIDITLVVTSIYIVGIHIVGPNTELHGRAIVHVPSSSNVTLAYEFLKGVDYNIGDISVATTNGLAAGQYDPGANGNKLRINLDTRPGGGGAQYYYITATRIA